MAKGEDRTVLREKRVKITNYASVKKDILFFIISLFLIDE